MATINISINEIFNKVQELKLLPKQIKKISYNNAIVLNIKPIEILPKIDLKFRFDEFSNGKAIFKVVGPFPINYAAKVLRKPINIYNHILEINKGYMQINLDKFVKEKASLIEISDIKFQNGEFNIELK